MKKIILAPVAATAVAAPIATTVGSANAAPVADQHITMNAGATELDGSPKVIHLDAVNSNFRSLS